MGSLTAAALQVRYKHETQWILLQEPGYRLFTIPLHSFIARLKNSGMLFKTIMADLGGECEGKLKIFLNEVSMVCSHVKIS